MTRTFPKLPRRRDTKCKCGGRAYLRVESTTLRAGAKKWRVEVERVCFSCALLYNHALVGFECTAACKRQRVKATGLKLSAQDQTVWVNLGQVLSVRSRAPKCPWCGKPMKSHRAPSSAAKMAENKR